METELTDLLSLHTSDHDTIARYLEPHLPLIKSRPLSALYSDLRYHRTTYITYIPHLVQDSVTDYRLHAVLKQLTVWIRTALRMKTGVD